MWIDVYDAHERPARQVRPSYFSQALQPGDFQYLENVRFNNGVLTARLGTRKIIAAMPAGASAAIDLGFCELNGTTYLVGAFNVSADIAIYTSVSPYTAWTEISEASGSWNGDASGNSRFPTVSDRVSFAVARAPFGRQNGSAIPARDCLIIQNGEDRPRIWDPQAEAGSTFTVCESLTLPTNFERLRQTAIFNTYHQVASASPKVTPAPSGRTQQVNYNLGATSAAPYTTPNICILWTIGTGVLAADIATCKFPTTITLRSMLVFVVEGIASDSAFSQAKVEIAPESSAYATTLAWQTVYNPDDTTGTYNKRVIHQLDASTTTPRFIVAFPLDHLDPALRVSTHIRFTRSTNSTAPSAGQLVTILLCASGGDFEGGTNWAGAYEDRYGRSEGPGVDPNLVTSATLKQMGGPAVVTGNPAADFNIGVPFSDIYYDYDVQFRNADGSDLIIGGLQGQPSRFNLYARAPGEDVAYYMYSVGLYTAGTSPVSGGSSNTKVWAKSYVGTPIANSAFANNGSGATRVTATAHGFSTGQKIFISGVTGTGGVSILNGTWSITVVDANHYDITQAFSGSWTPSTFGFSSPQQPLVKFSSNTLAARLGDRDFSRPVPTSFQIPIPTAAVVYSANNRLFTAAVKDSGLKILSDLYFSWQDNPFRFQAVPIGLSGQIEEAAGNHVSFPGETVTQIISAAAAAEGQSYVYVFTTKAVWALGGTSGVQSFTTDSVSLGNPDRIASVGCRCYRSIAEHNGNVSFLDTENQVRQIINGMPVDISRLHVDSLLKAIPAAHRADVVGFFFQDRYYLAITESGGTTNTLVLGWNNVLRVWEFTDAPPVPMQRAVTIYDSASDGSGQRAIFLGSDGFVYAYEEGLLEIAAATVAVRIVGPEDSFAAGSSFIIDTVVVETANVQANILTALRVYTAYGVAGSYSTPIDLSLGIYSDSDIAHTTVAAMMVDGVDRGEEGSSAYLDLYGPMTPGTKLTGIAIKARMTGAGLDARAT